MDIYWILVFWALGEALILYKTSKIVFPANLANQKYQIIVKSKNYEDRNLVISETKKLIELNTFLVNKWSGSNNFIYFNKLKFQRE